MNKIKLIIVKPINAYYSAISEKIETNFTAPKVDDKMRITKYKNIFSEG